MGKYSVLARAIVDYLRSHQRPNGTIYDVINKTMTPDNQYALTFFALATLIVGSDDSSEAYLKDAQNALNYYLELTATQRGCHEFNNLAVLLI